MGFRERPVEDVVMLSFFKDKRVFVTGHTGFKGSWLCKILDNSGAIVFGYALPPSANASLFSSCHFSANITSVYGDIREFDSLAAAFESARPEIVFHLAAQPLVRESYQNPRYTYETNVMGTVNLLECVRRSGCVRSFLNVTTDKVYKDNEGKWAYREDEPLDGFDPYSNSKSCSELVTHCYRNAFFSGSSVAVSTARAGNVIGGGDWAADRIIPDCIRAALKNEDILVRNPRSIRPYQHVLDPLAAYLMIAAKQSDHPNLAGYYNIGPDELDCVETGALADLFCKAWGGLRWINLSEANAPHEANFLKLDSSRLKHVFGWLPRWNVSQAIEKTVEWAKAFQQGQDVSALMDAQIRAFYEG